MKNLLWLRGCVVAVMFAVAAGLFISCSTLDQAVVDPPQIEGATYVGNKACADCHTNIARAFAPAWRMRS